MFVNIMRQASSLGGLTVWDWFYQILLSLEMEGTSLKEIESYAEMECIVKFMPSPHQFQLQLKFTYMYMFYSNAELLGLIPIF